MEESLQPLSRRELPRGEVMQTPDEVAAMLRLKGLGWGIKRIARELGCSHMMVRHYVALGGWLPYRGPADAGCWPGLRIGWPSAFAATAATPTSCVRSFWPKRASS